MQETDLPLRIETLAADVTWLGPLARSLVRNPDLADDLVQDVYVRAIEKPPRDLAAPRAWLAKVLRNEARQKHRGDAARTRREQHTHESKPDAHADTSEVVARVEGQRRLVESVMELPPDYRDVIVLRFFEELDNGAIGRRLDLPVSTVATRLRRGLRLLRERIEARYGSEARTWLSAIAAMAPVGSGAGGSATLEPPAMTGNGVPATPSSLSVKLALVSTIAIVVTVGIVLTQRESAPFEPRDSQLVRTRTPSGSAATVTTSRAVASSGEVGDAITDVQAESETTTIDNNAPPPAETFSIDLLVFIDERPAEGGTAYLDERGRWITSTSVDENPSETFHTATIHRDGRARFSGLTSRRIRVGVEFGDAPILQRRAHIAEDRKGPLELHLGSGRITGRVYSSAGDPVANARLTFGMKRGSDYGALEAQVVTDRDGAYEFDRLPGETYWIYAELPTSPEEKSAPSERLRAQGKLAAREWRTVDLGRDEPMIQVRGSVLDPEGKPIRFDRDQRIELEFRSVGEQDRKVRMATAASDGTYVAALRPGTYEIIAKLPGASHAVVLANARLIDTADIDQDLDVSGASVRGEVFDAATGATLTPDSIDAIPTLQLAASDSNRTFRATVKPDGSFVFYGVPPGRWRLTSSPPTAQEPPELTISPSDTTRTLDVWIATE